jgi:hypothetical protein
MQYTDFCAEFIVNPDTLADNDNDDPLGASAGDDSSKYSEYFKNKELILEIDKDTKRTWSSMHFFAVPGPQQDQPSHIAGPSNQQARAACCSNRLVVLLTQPTRGFIHPCCAGVAPAVHSTRPVCVCQAEPRHSICSGHE